MDKVNNEIFLNSLTSYSGYQFVEMVFVLAVTVFQVHMIKKMFRDDSILWSLFINYISLNQSIFFTMLNVT